MDKNDTVFIDVNTQNDFLDLHGSQYIPKGTSIKRNLGRLIQTAVNKKITIISIMNTHTRNDPEFTTFNPHCIVNTLGWQKIPETQFDNFQVFQPQEDKNLKLKSNRFILLNPKVSPFGNFNTMNLIRAIKKKTFIIFGIPTDSVVLDLSVDLVKNGFVVYVVRDATLGVNEAHSEMALEEMAEKGVKLVKTSEVIIELGRQ